MPPVAVELESVPETLLWTLHHRVVEESVPAHREQALSMGFMGPGLRDR